MDEERLRIVCEVCGEVVDPDDPDVVQAFKQINATGYRGPRHTVDGLLVCFHKACFPHDTTSYRLDA